MSELGSEYHRSSRRNTVEVDRRGPLWSLVNQEASGAFLGSSTNVFHPVWDESLHFSRVHPDETISAALARHEHYLAGKMLLRPGLSVLDIGCGLGGPACSIARFSGVNVFGIDKDTKKLGQARERARHFGLDHQTYFAEGDFMQLSDLFDAGTFDAAFSIEATVYASSLEAVYRQAFNVLKPGGVFGVYEWATTNIWDPCVPTHRSLARRIERTSGISELHSIQSVRKAMIDAGFEIIHDEDLALRPDAIPWYSPLQGDIRQARTWQEFATSLRVSPAGRGVMKAAARFIGLLGFLSRRDVQVSEWQNEAAEALVEAGRSRLFTPMYLMVARKPSLK